MVGKRRYLKTMFSATDLRLMQALDSVLAGTDAWSRRWAVAGYVQLCEMAGFCSTDDMRRLCAQRWLAGKRKVSPPGARRRKNAEREMRRLLADAPPPLTRAIEAVATTDAAAQFVAGNGKALNALVGMVLRQYKVDPAVVRALLIRRLTPNV